MTQFSEDTKVKEQPNSWNKLEMMNLGFGCRPQNLGLPRGTWNTEISIVMGYRMQRREYKEHLVPTQLRMVPEVFRFVYSQRSQVFRTHGHKQALNRFETQGVQVIRRLRGEC
jgi:hypothetical protein